MLGFGRTFESSSSLRSVWQTCEVVTLGVETNEAGVRIFEELPRKEEFSEGRIKGIQEDAVRSKRAWLRAKTGMLLLLKKHLSR